MTGKTQVLAGLSAGIAGVFSVALFAFCYDVATDQYQANHLWPVLAVFGLGAVGWIATTALLVRNTRI